LSSDTTTKYAGAVKGELDDVRARLRNERDELDVVQGRVDALATTESELVALLKHLGEASS
jgi:hypothetical protein